MASYFHYVVSPSSVLIPNVFFFSISASLYTVLTSRAFERLLSFMHMFLMFCQIILSWKSVITSKTIVWLFSFVYRFHVLFHCKFVWTILIANWAIVWLFFFLHWFHLPLQITFMWAGVITNNTEITFFIDLFIDFLSQCSTVSPVYSMSAQNWVKDICRLYRPDQFHYSQWIGQKKLRNPQEIRKKGPFGSQR